MRTDKGTEANLMEVLHIVLRYDHEDDLAGYRSFLRGKSTRNQRIESYWRQFRQHLGDFYIDIFRKMESYKLLDINNSLHIECIRFCFGNLIEEEILITQKEWNEHRIRKQNNRGILSGIPDEMYKCPELFGAVDYRKEVNLDHVEKLMKHVKEPFLVSQTFKELLNVLMPNYEKPCTAEMCLKLYVDIVESIERIQHM